MMADGGGVNENLKHNHIVVFKVLLTWINGLTVITGNDLIYYPGVRAALAHPPK